MSIEYLEGRPWSDWTRDERYFCSVLYNHAQNDPSRFAELVDSAADLGLPLEGKWEVGYEVSFYRDFLWQRNEKKSTDLGVSDQRAFDLCLFGENAIVVIEAKVFEPFSLAQNKVFGLDKDHIKRLPGLKNIDVRLVALASSRYFDNQAKYGHNGTLEMFDGVVSWEHMAEAYSSDLLLAQANRTYKIKPGESPSEPPV